MKYKIEKNTAGDADHSAVCAEGLLRTIPESLTGTKQRFARLTIDYDFSGRRRKLRSLMQRFGSLEVAMRAE